MDPRLRNFPTSVNQNQLGNSPVVPFVPNQRFEINSCLDHNYPQIPFFSSNLNPCNVMGKSNGSSHGDESPEDCDFSDTVLSYINQILMEENTEDSSRFQDSLDLQAAERSFYEVLNQKYPPSPDRNLVSVIQNGYQYPYENFIRDSSQCHYDYSNGFFNNNACMQGSSPCDSSSPALSVSSMSQSIHSSSSVSTSIDGLVDSPGSAIPIPDWSGESRSISQFIKGVEEANKFLPNSANFFNTNFPESKTTNGEVNREYFSVERRGRKSPLRDNGDDIEEGRCSKQPSVYVETEIEPQVFDRMMLYTAGEGWEDFNNLCDKLKNASIKDDSKVQAKGVKNTKGRRKKSTRKKEVVDLRSLLISCSQAVAADDIARANELIKQVRQHSSPFGDGNQRLAHLFANGLEARLSGTGSQIYRGLVSKRGSTANLLKAYHLYLAASPFRKLTNFVTNLTIMNRAAKSTKLHVIDFGIFYGFQWPTLIQRLSWRDGGPPTLRITGIDFPQPGFRPAERVEETGRRLAIYAKQFSVPFMYKGIAKKWETITLEELEIAEDEIVFVTCLYWAKNLLDETVAKNSPKDILLELVKKIKPDVFIHGINNAAYNAPFFVTRFREALHHFSSLFDMLDTIVPRDNVERMLIEKELIGREALNAVACEGSERVERPETYKQWQVRSLRAGFVQLPIDAEIIKQAFVKVRKLYHKDFLFDQDGHWLLQGWKGRILFTLSAWRP